MWKLHTDMVKHVPKGVENKTYPENDPGPGHIKVKAILFASVSWAV